MATLVLIFYIAFIISAVGLRIVIHLLRSGSTGVHGISGQFGSLEWLGGSLFILAFLLGLAAPICDLMAVVEPIAALNGEIGHLLGIALFGLGFAGVIYAQIVMGNSWRIGVDPEEETEFVARGPFALVRNPIFSLLLLTGLGLFLLLPNVFALIAFVALFVSIEIQVRFVEEPYLQALHGDRYASYSRRVGRFMPLIGRRSSRSASAGL